MAESFVMLNKALVRSHLEYTNAICSPYKNCDIYVLEGVQRRATKLINLIKHLSYENRLKVLELPTLKYRRERGVMIEFLRWCIVIMIILTTFLFCLMLILLQGEANINCIKVLLNINMILESTFSVIEWCHYGIVCLMLLWTLILLIVYKSTR